MQYKILPAAEHALIQIWNYTEQKWGENQANAYIHAIYDTVKDISDKRHLWRDMKHEKFRSIFFVRYKHHYIFFRELSKNTIGIISVLHERMNIPDRLRTDLDMAGM